MNHSAIAALCLSVLASFGCAAEFDPGARVVSLRVLAQQTDLPFAKPGETVNIRSLSYDPEARPLSWAWGACVNPNESTVEGCLAKIDADSAQSGTSPVLAQGTDLSDFNYTVPSDALSTLPSAARPSAMVGILSIACPGDIDFEHGSNQLSFSCRDRTTGRSLGLDEFVLGLKRIAVRDGDRNHNPVIDRVTFDGAPWPEDELKVVSPCATDGNDYKPCAGASKHQIAAVPSSNSTESGRTEFGIDFHEQVVVEYYATEGVFENEVKIAAQPATGWAARKTASGKDLTLWMVVHDDRGGASWATRKVHVE